MGIGKNLLVPLAGVGVLAGEVLHLAHRRDLPSLENQEPSGVFGDPASPELRVVALGDSSITAPGVEPLDASWIRQVADALGESWFVRLHSVAVGGAKARDVLDHQLASAIHFQPDIAIVSVGANDALRGTPVARFEKELDLITAHLAGVARLGVCVTGVGDLGTIPRLTTLPRAFARVRSRSIDRAVARVVAPYDTVIKGTTWGPDWEPFAVDPGMFAGDLFHASAQGHEIFAQMMIPLVRRLLHPGPLHPSPGSPGPVSDRPGNSGSST